MWDEECNASAPEGPQMNFITQLTLIFSALLLAVLMLPIWMGHP
jgi:hypothetical protein